MDRDEMNRVEELLMQHVTGALSAPEGVALTNTLTPTLRREAAHWEIAAAELTAVLAIDARSAADAMPSALADRIVGVGEALVRTTARSSTTLNASTTVTELPTTNRSRRSFAIWGGWLAAAAMLAIWASGNVTRDENTPKGAVVATSRGSQLRDSLLTVDSNVVRLAWSTTGDSSARGATGDVVWSERAQRGVMRIAGLQPNDRKRWQYQLWIFDKKRDQRYPVDGGVFDIPPGATEVFVPIDARVPVGDAIMFAVTVEPPGGVVVSKRERIALLAKRS